MKSTTRLSAFFAAYFAYVGLFSPYLSLWLNGRGFSPTEIGVLISPMQWARVVGPPAWGWMADHVQGRSGVARLIQVAALAALISSLMLLTELSFWPLFIVFCVMSFFLSGQVPIAESLAMQAGGGSLKRYGRIRVWGSIGFIAAVMLAGPWFDRVGIFWLPASLIAVLAVLVLVTLLLPHREVHDLAPQSALTKDMLRNPQVKRFLWASFLMLVAHAPLYTLFSLWLHQQGYSSTEIGLLWTLGVVAEIFMFRFQHRLFDRFSVGQCWVASYAVTAIRFLMIAFSGGSLWVLIAAQLLHAVTFGVHHSASMALIREWFPAQAQARGQAFYTMASYGLGGSLGGIAAGWLWEAVSPEFTFIVSAAAAAIGVLIAASGLRGQGGDGQLRPDAKA
ncbi:MAG: MFS transporter [Burkholderiaceae bacterium]|nr:MFS transporter [Burkholderiaceae bacterium]